MYDKQNNNNYYNSTTTAAAAAAAAKGQSTVVMDGSRFGVVFGDIPLTFFSSVS
ncbi:hypothetical protein Sjap_022678 [Stephania japonica]|uniref:Uncharacterized protein n=1 Tax=Stephania japonica TaxID=461633 RepID=A0AAP0EPV3_9MAGN